MTRATLTIHGSLKHTTMLGLVTTIENEMRDVTQPEDTVEKFEPTGNKIYTILVSGTEGITG